MRSQAKNFAISRPSAVFGAVLIVVFALVGMAGTAEAQGGMRIVAPKRAETPQEVRFAVDASKPMRRVIFYVDGRRRWVDRSPGWKFGHNGYLPTAGMAVGRHHLTVKAKERNGRVVKTKRPLYLARKSTSKGNGQTQTSTPTTTQTTTSTSSDVLFNGAHLSDFAQLQEAPGAISEVTDPLGSGSNTYKMTVSDQDVYPVTPTDNPRAQALSPGIINPGDDIWLKTKFMLPQDFPSVPGWMSLIEIYGPPFNGTSPWHIAINDNEFRWQRNGNYNWDIPWRMPLVRGRWITVLLHERFAGDGYAEMWIDGNRATFFPSGNYNPDHHASTDHLPMATMDSSNDGGANSAKIMQYRQAGMFDTATVYFGALQVGRTQASVGG